MPKRKHFSVEEIAEFLEKSVGDVTDFILYSQVLRGAVITKKVLTGSESGLTRYWSSDDGNNGVLQKPLLTMDGRQVSSPPCQNIST
jgi:hypothetical protein